MDTQKAAFAALERMSGDQRESLVELIYKHSERFHGILPAMELYRAHKREILGYVKGGDKTVKYISGFVCAGDELPVAVVVVMMLMPLAQAMGREKVVEYFSRSF
jgi:hypothetical protein